MAVRSGRARHSTVGVLGLGRFGLALRNSLNAIGVPVNARGSKDREREPLSIWIAGCQVVCLAVRDDQLPGLVAAMDHEGLQGKTVLIHAGTTPLALLAPLHARGATVGKFHPLQSFTQSGGDAEIPKGTPFAVEGEILELVEPWVRAWSGEVHRLRSEDWLVYHLAAVTAANFLPLLIRSGAKILEPLAPNSQAALSWLRPLVQTSVDLALNGAVSLPFSGPAIRRDRQTMARHRRYLETHFPELAPLYELASDRIMGWSENREDKPDKKPTEGGENRE